MKMKTTKFNFAGPCQTCTDPDKYVQVTCGPDTFGKRKERICCENNDCEYWSESRSTQGLKAKEIKDEQKEKVPAKKATAKKKSPAKKATKKKQ